MICLYKVNGIVVTNERSFLYLIERLVKQLRFHRNDFRQQYLRAYA